MDHAASRATGHTLLGETENKHMGERITVRERERGEGALPPAGRRSGGC